MSTIQNFTCRIATAEHSRLDCQWKTELFNPCYRYIPWSRLFIPCSGEGMVEYAGQVHVLKRGMMLLIPPFSKFRCSCKKELVKYWTHFNLSTGGCVNDLFSLLPGGVTELPLPEKDFRSTAMIFDRLIRLVKKSCSNGNWTNPLDHLSASSALIMLLEPFLKLLPADNQIPIRHNDRIMELLNYMNSNLGENLTLEKLARHAGLHPTYLSALFHQCIGISPIAYLNARRDILARNELSRDNLRIGEIAERLGFRNVAAFSRFFHGRARISPSEYRRKHLKNPSDDDQDGSAGAPKYIG